MTQTKRIKPPALPRAVTQAINRRAFDLSSRRYPVIRGQLMLAATDAVALGRDPLAAVEAAAESLERPTA